MLERHAREPKHTARQRGYGHTRGDRELYTPQVFVNGVLQVLGSDRNAIESAIQRARAGHTLLLPVSITMNNEQIQVTVGPAKSRARRENLVVRAYESVPVEVKRGENRGRHHRLPQCSAAGSAWPLDGRDQYLDSAYRSVRKDGSNAVSVLVQAARWETGPVLGAALASLRYLGRASETQRRTKKDRLKPTGQLTNSYIRFFKDPARLRPRGAWGLRNPGRNRPGPEPSFLKASRRVIDRTAASCDPLTSL